MNTQFARVDKDYINLNKGRYSDVNFLESPDQWQPQLKWNISLNNWMKVIFLECMTENSYFIRNSWFVFAADIIVALPNPVEDIHVAHQCSVLKHSYTWIFYRYHTHNKGKCDLHTQHYSCLCLHGCAIHSRPEVVWWMPVYMWMYWCQGRPILVLRKVQL